MADSDAYRDLGGGIPAPDETPAHHWRCDGTGYTANVHPADRLPVACPVCRPHAATRHGRVRTRAIPVR